jgi:cellobiose phosphorylase
VLVIRPAIPAAWPGFEVTYTFEATEYRISVSNPARVSQGLASAEADGRPLGIGDATAAFVPLRRAGGVVHIVLKMGHCSRAAVAE